MENQMRPHGRRKAARRPFGAMVIHVKRVVNDIDLRNRKKKKTEWGGVMDIRRIEILSLCRWGIFQKCLARGDISIQNKLSPDRTWYENKVFSIFTTRTLETLLGRRFSLHIFKGSSHQLAEIHGQIWDLLKLPPLFLPPKFITLPSEIPFRCTAADIARTEN
jgi:hypothetical protein